MTCERCGGPNTNTDTVICNQCWINLMRQDPIEGWEYIPDQEEAER